MSPVTLGSLVPTHRERLEEILLATGSFHDDEVDVALELFDDQTDDYQFVGAFDDGGALFGYACYGATPSTDRTWDLYWIAVHPDHQGSGGGSKLIDEVEVRLARRNARMLVVETSSRDDYESTRQFYERRGYAEQVRVRDYYAPGDDRVVLVKRLSPSS